MDWTMREKIGSLPPHDVSSAGPARIAALYEAPASFRIGKVFADSFDLLGRNLPLLLGMALIFSGLPTLATELVSRGATDAAFDDFEFSSQDLAFATGMLGSMLLGLVQQAAVMRAAVEDMAGERPSFADCMGTAFAVFLPTLGIALISVLIIFAAWLLVALSAFVLGPFAVLAGIAVAAFVMVIWVRWAVALPALVQERPGVFGSLRRSAALTKGSRWAVLGLILVLLVLVVVLVGVSLVANQFPTAIELALVVLESTASSLIGTIAIAVAYVQLRLVKEGTSVTDLAKIFA
jgi:hypothetical protein